MLKIDPDICTLCRLCIQNCPFGALEVLDDQVQVNDRCILCGSCINVCRSQALKIERKQVPQDELEQYRGVYVWVELETKEGRRRPKKVAFELLSKGRLLADQLEQEVVALVIGGPDMEGLDSFADFGVDRVLCCRHELLGEYSTDSYTSVICAVIARKKPAILLYGATPNGRDLAPRVAARLHLGLTADCTGLEIDAGGQLVQTRPAFGGNIMASIITPETRPQMATVRPNVFAALKSQAPSQPVREDFPVVLQRSALRTRVVERQVQESSEQDKINEAEVIVAAGRGCRKADNLSMLRELARLLDGTIAGTRAVVEEGWLGHSRQVGQSGTTVSPDLYIAVGISGAVQHIVGMSSAQTIIAINNDPEAAIFKIASLGIVGDALEILPRLNALLEKMKMDKG